MVDIIVFLKVIALLVTIMIVWFKSSAFPAYCKLFGFRKILLGYDKNSDNLTFTQYLYIKSRTVFKCSICAFIIELITCPLCLGFWLSVLGACLFLHYTLIPTVYLTVLISYFLAERVIG